MWIINPTVGCHYFLWGLQLPLQPLRGLLPILLLGEQRHNGCEQFAYDCYPKASRLRFKPRPFCTWVQHANHSATEPPEANMYKQKLQQKKTTLAGCEKSLLLTKNCFMQLDKNYSPGIDCPPLHHSRRRTSRTWHRRDRDRGGKLGHRPCRRRRRRPSCMCGSDTSAGSWTPSGLSCTYTACCSATHHPVSQHRQMWHAVTVKAQAVTVTVATVIQFTVMHRTKTKQKKI